MLCACAARNALLPRCTRRCRCRGKGRTNSFTAAPRSTSRHGRMLAPDRVSTQMLTGTCALRPTRFIVPADWQSMMADMLLMFKLRSVQIDIALWLPRPSKACARNLAILTAYIATARLSSSCSCRTCTPRSGHISGVATGLVFVPMCAHVCSTACQACCVCTIKRVLLSVCGHPAVAIPSSDRVPPIDAVPHA